MSARKKTEKCSTGHILENQGSIRYHDKMSYLRFITSKKNKKTSSQSATLPHKKNIKISL